MVNEEGMYQFQEKSKLNGESFPSLPNSVEKQPLKGKKNCLKETRGSFDLGAITENEIT